MYDVSVNVTTETNNKDDFWKYLTPDIDETKYKQWGVAYLSDIEWVRGKIRKDPRDRNPYHCLLSGPVKRIVGKFTHKTMPSKKTKR